MIRSFIALSLPFGVAADLERLRAPIPDARWVTLENLHITLAFLGDQTPNALEDADLALSGLRLRLGMIKPALFANPQSGGGRAAAGRSRPRRG